MLIEEVQIWHKKLWFIDDEIEILNMLKRYFMLDNYDVITAAGGQEAYRS